MTNIERTLLINQFRILSLLDQDNRKQHEANARILEDGHAYLYENVLTNFSEGSSIEVGEEVYQILNMFRAINNAVLRLTPEEQQQVDKRALEFAGFDGNDPQGHYHLAYFITDKMGLYTEFDSKDMNSHNYSSLSSYRSMLGLYNSYPNKNALTVDQLQQLAEARDNY